MGPGLANAELTEPGASMATVVEFLDGTTFREAGTLDYGEGNRVFFRSVAPGVLAPERDGSTRGRSTLEIVGGAGRFSAARGSISSDFVVSSDGMVVDERIVDMVIDTEEEGQHD